MTKRRNLTKQYEEAKARSEKSAVLFIDQLGDAFMTIIKTSKEHGTSRALGKAQELLAKLGKSFIQTRQDAYVCGGASYAAYLNTHLK